MRVPIVVLTARTEEHDRVRGLDLGADDYVSKPFSVRELLARVRAQVRRDDWRSPSGEQFALGDVVVIPRQRLVLKQGKRIALSAREFELLRYLFAHRNEVVSREQLLRDVWGYHELSVTRTVDNYMAKLRTHIEPQPHAPQLHHHRARQRLPAAGVRRRGHRSGDQSRGGCRQARKRSRPSQKPSASPGIVIRSAAQSAGVVRRMLRMDCPSIALCFACVALAVPVAGWQPSNAASAVAPQSPQAVLDGLLADERALSDAAATLSPAEGLASLMADDGVLMTRSGPVTGRAAAMEEPERQSRQ